MVSFEYNTRYFSLDADKARMLVADTVTSKWITDTLTGRERSAALSALIAEHSAMTYAWGRQDAGESKHDSDVAIEFGKAYGRHAYRFRIGDHYRMTNIPRAYELWLAGELDQDKEQ